MKLGTWEELLKAITTCRRCPLHASRKKPVPGEGPKSTEVMLVGEAPGASEDEAGRPFVGAAGRLLTAVLEASGVPRSSVYITNVVKCRPPGNREPRQEEIDACSPYLETQLKLIRPRLVVTLGNVAGRWFFTRAGIPWPGIMKARGRVRRISVAGVEFTLLPTIHPAAALYNPRLRRVFEEDIAKIRKVLEVVGGGAPAKTRSLLQYIEKQQSRENPENCGVGG